MADTHSHEHNGVAYEHTDASPLPIVIAGVGFVVLTALTMLGLYLLNNFLFAAEDASKKTDQPAAAADQRPPEPRLEEIDDVRAGRAELHPERGKWYKEPQEKELAEGNKKTGAIPITAAMKALSGRLPAQKGPAPGPFFERRTYSRASSGQKPTGGE